MIELQDVLAARQTLEGYIHRTPVIGSNYFSERIGAKVLLKLESFQKTGSFKVRGALNKLHFLSPSEKKRGVISFSAGNHGQSLAYAASLSGIPSTLVMPTTAVKSKVKATEGYGGIVHLTESDLLETTLAIQREHGQTLVHPFDDLKIIAGAGTVGLEVLEDVPDVNVVIAGVGGGGLVSGIAAVAKLTNPRINVTGVEPEGAAAMYHSLAKGKPINLSDLNTVADGLASPFVGIHTLAHVQRFVDNIVVVSDEEIMDALVSIMERCKVVVEPAGAASVAALISGKAKVEPGSTVVCIISGGNIGEEDLKRLL